MPTRTPPACARAPRACSRATRAGSRRRAGQRLREHVNVVGVGNPAWEQCAHTSHGGSSASGQAHDSSGIASGNSVQAPIHVPVNVCGNSVNVVGVGNPVVGNECTHTSHGGSSASGQAHESSGIASGNSVQAPIPGAGQRVRELRQRARRGQPRGGNSCGTSQEGGGSSSSGGSPRTGTPAARPASAPATTCSSRSTFRSTSAATASTWPASATRWWATSAPPRARTPRPRRTRTPRPRPTMSRPPSPAPPCRVRPPRPIGRIPPAG